MIDVGVFSYVCTGVAIFYGLRLYNSTNANMFCRFLIFFSKFVVTKHPLKAGICIKYCQMHSKYKEKELCGVANYRTNWV